MHTELEIHEVRTAERDNDALWNDFQSAMSVLRGRIHGNGASDLVLAELIEDDLRQARIALHRIHEFLDDAVATVGEPQSSPADLVDAADTSRALEACSELESLMPAIRRRLGQVALRLVRR